MEDSYKHKGMRKQLIKKLEQKHIKDKHVLSAIDKVPRHFFFDKAFLEQSYKDIAFPIGEGQTISQPYTVAFQTTLLEIKKGDKVLEIGTGSGYQCCILLEMGAKVFTIEKNEVLFKKVIALLPQMNYHPYFFLGDGTIGLPQYAPFDKIIVTAGSPKVPEKLVEQLGPDGVLVIPVGDENAQKMIRIKKSSDGKIHQEEHGIFKFVPLIGKDGWRTGNN
jgi:protein-L-isoaspartate(D-aspartate) O-methyltransferase